MPFYFFFSNLFIVEVTLGSNEPLFPFDMSCELGEGAHHSITQAVNKQHLVQYLSMKWLPFGYGTNDENKLST